MTIGSEFYCVQKQVWSGSSQHSFRVKVVYMCV